MAVNEGYRVLVVDDEQGIRIVLENLLDAEGYEVLLASNGREALDVLAERRPDVIILDLAMPVMSGVEFREELLGLCDGYASIPLVVLSGTRDARRRAEKMGASAVITKPFDIDEVVTILSDILTSTAEQ